MQHKKKYKISGPSQKLYQLPSVMQQKLYQKLKKKHSPRQFIQQRSYQKINKPYQNISKPYQNLNISYQKRNKQYQNRNKQYQEVNKSYQRRNKQYQKLNRSYQKLNRSYQKQRNQQKQSQQIKRPKPHDKQNKSIKSLKYHHYQPRILQSYVEQKQYKKRNPQSYREMNQQIYRNRIYSQQEFINQDRMDKLKQWKPSKKLSTILNRVGLKTDKDSIGLRSQHSLNINKSNSNIIKSNLRNGQFIYRKKRDSSSSSMFRGAKTQPSQNNLRTIKQLKSKNSKTHRDSVNSLVQTHINSKLLLNNSSRKKLPLIRQMNGMNQLSNKLINRKIRTQQNSPSALQLIRHHQQKTQQQVNRMLQKSHLKSFQQRQSKLSIRQTREQKLKNQLKQLINDQQGKRIHKRQKPLLNEKRKKLQLLQVKQEMLGKIVLERVQKHFVQDKKIKQGNYITKVNSQKSIDQALIQFLKMKINRVDHYLS